jgi:hypothetical protein
VKDLRREWKQIRYLRLSIRAHTAKYTASQYNVKRYRMTFSRADPLFAADPPVGLSGSHGVIAWGRFGWAKTGSRGTRADQGVRPTVDAR